MAEGLDLLTAEELNVFLRNYKSNHITQNKQQEWLRKNKS